MLSKRQRLVIYIPFLACIMIALAASWLQPTASVKAKILLRLLV